MLHTFGQFRFARTYFPAFDHPALKAQFQLCLRYPPGWQVTWRPPHGKERRYVGML